MLVDRQAVMDDERLQRAVLEKVRRWGRLTYGDVQAMLPVELRVRLRERTVQAMAEQGLVRIVWAGDELVLTMTEEGERYLAERSR